MGKETSSPSCQPHSPFVFLILYHTTLYHLCFATSETGAPPPALKNVSKNGKQNLLTSLTALQAPLFSDLINELHKWNDQTLNGAILFAYLPTLMLLAVTTILPLVIWCTPLCCLVTIISDVIFITTSVSSIFEGHHVKSSTHKHLVVKIYVFLLFSVLLLPCLFLTSLDALIRKGALLVWNEN